MLPRCGTVCLAQMEFSSYLAVWNDPSQSGFSLIHVFLPILPALPIRWFVCWLCASQIALINGCTPPDDCPVFCPAPWEFIPPLHPPSLCDRLKTIYRQQRRCRVLNLWWTWFAVCLLYYGLTFGAGKVRAARAATPVCVSRSRIRGVQSSLRAVSLPSLSLAGYSTDTMMLYTLLVVCWLLFCCCW